MLPAEISSAIWALRYKIFSFLFALKIALGGSMFWNIYTKLSFPWQPNIGVIGPMIKTLEENVPLTFQMSKFGNTMECSQ